MSTFSAASVTTTRHMWLATLAVNDGLVQPCPQCGMSSILTAYDRLTLALALSRRTALDPNPTHLCVPPPPDGPARQRRLVENLVESIATQVVETWTA